MNPQLIHFSSELTDLGVVVCYPCLHYIVIPPPPTPHPAAPSLPTTDAHPQSREHVGALLTAFPHLWCHSQGSFLVSKLLMAQSLPFPSSCPLLPFHLHP